VSINLCITTASLLYRLARLPQHCTPMRLCCCAHNPSASLLSQVRSNKRYAGAGQFTVSEVAERVKADIGNIDVLVSC
jgi:hypothetical protein